MLGRNPLTCFEVGGMTVPGSQSRLGQGRGLAAEASRMPHVPPPHSPCRPETYQRPLRLPCHQRSRVRRVQFSACQGEGWCLGSKEKRREGHRMSLLTRCPSGSHQRLAALQTSSSRPRARPPREASCSVPWVPHESLGPGEVLNLSPARPIRGPL